MNVKEIPLALVEDSDEVLEQCDIAVCLEKTDDNLARVPPMWRNEIGYGKCMECGTEIFFRTNIPENSRKMCMPCAMEAIADDESPVLVTRKTGLEEYEEYLRKKEQN